MNIINYINQSKKRYQFYLIQFKKFVDMNIEQNMIIIDYINQSKK